MKCLKWIVTFPTYILLQFLSLLGELENQVTRKSCRLCKSTKLLRWAESSVQASWFLTCVTLPPLCIYFKTAFEDTL